MTLVLTGFQVGWYADTGGCQGRDGRGEAGGRDAAAELVARVADRLGFPGPTHFGEFFHRHTGQSRIRIPAATGSRR